jgi:tRNA threonylcarbamoyl adenosine modification protein (Sua5/YciO/YrdC/YwlC family)
LYHIYDNIQLSKNVKKAIFGLILAIYLQKSNDMSKLMTWLDSTVLAKIDAVLESDGLIITDTDTVLGLLARCTQQSFDALNGCKGRQEKPYLLLVRDVTVAKKYVASTHHHSLDTLGAAFWPGEVTMIFPAAAHVPSFMCSREGTIALRVTQHPGLMRVLERHEILFSTSANKAGMPVPTSLDEVDESLKAHVELFVSQENPEPRQSLPSTIIDCTTVPLTIVREGAVSRQEIERVAKLSVGQ